MRRVMLGMSQTDLAQAIGVTFQQIQKYEKGTNRVSAGRMQQFAKCLDVPVTFFFDGAPEARVGDGRKSNANSAVAPAYVTHFLTSREGQDFMKAFSRIGNRQRRRELVYLAQQLAVNGARSR